MIDEFLKRLIKSIPEENQIIFEKEILPDAYEDKIREADYVDWLMRSGAIKMLGQWLSEVNFKNIIVTVQSGL